ncbi:MAG: aldehyde ferredoxin oxidoreductase C-terminal domain-containing protein, partial [Desulfurococcaceae archaeon]
HVAPAMALAYGTSPIGAHHKDAWIISYEVKTDRMGYTVDKVEKLVFLQDMRGGMFESLTTCRFPWVEVGLDLDYYPRMLTAITGIDWSLDDIRVVSNRIYTLIRAFWIREHGEWDREKDIPPLRWFKEPLTKGPYAGKHLDLGKYNEMLSAYYEMRGWSENGIPRRETLDKLNLGFVTGVLEDLVELG